MAGTQFIRQGLELTVKPDGQLDLLAATALEKELMPELEGVEAVVMDFADVGYITSGGLRLLLAVDQMMRDRGGSMKVIHVQEAVAAVFELVGFLDSLDVETA